MEKKNYQIKAFPSEAAWKEWLAKEHQTTQGIWIKLAKKSSGIPSVTYEQAVLVALCYGWIDGQAGSFDEEYYLQKFTPRGAKSMWSKINCERVARLTAEGKMTAAGIEKVAAAKKDGRWDQAYDSPKNMAIPEDFLKELEKNEKAYAFFKTLNKTNTYAISWRLHTAKKPETRARRIGVIITMLSEEKKLH
jgi:uncharacterized protein YdeI (YjbR/CyaY-like superfamily)